MEMTRIKWDEGMAVRCLARCKSPYITVKTMEKAAINKPIQKVGYWDEFNKAIDNAYQEK